MAILNFSDVLRNVGLDPKRVKLIRHSLGDKAFKKCYDKNMVEEYTAYRVKPSATGMIIGAYLSATRVRRQSFSPATR